MKKNIVILLLIAICLPISLFSQYEKYPVLFSQQYSFGSARVMGMGSAYSALGSEYSIVSINPAGLARSTRSAVSFTGGIYTSKLNTNYYNTSTTERDVELDLNEFSIYKAIKIKDTKWRYAHFGAGYIRHRKLRETYRAQGTFVRSLADDFADRGFGVEPENLLSTRPFDSFLAYETYLIDPYYDSASNSTYYLTNLPDTAQTRKDVLVENYGNFGEFNISFSGNYNNKLYVGASIGIPTLKYEEKKTHSETATTGDTTGIQSFTFTESILTRGTGINFKLGLIYLPTNWLRIGLSAHTPSRIVMKEQYTADMRSKVDQITYDISEDLRPTGSFEYVIQTPWKVNLSLATVIAKRFVISVEADYLNYKNATLKSSRDPNYQADFGFENDIIDNTTRDVAFNVRGGLEVRLIKTLAIRAGYGYYQSPYNNANLDQQSDVMSFSGGIGYRMKHFFIDLAYVRRMRSRNVYTVNPEFSEPATVDGVKNNIALTVGYRF